MRRKPTTCAEQSDGLYGFSREDKGRFLDNLSFKDGFAGYVICKGAEHTDRTVDARGTPSCLVEVCKLERELVYGRQYDKRQVR